MDIHLLRQQHDDLEIVAGELLLAISSETYQSVATLRWKLARELIVHLGLEDRLLYPALIDGSNRAAALMATQFKTEMGGLADGFTAYMATWDSQRMVKEWPAFCRETRAILALLGARIDRENRDLYPQAAVIESRVDRLPCQQGAILPISAIATNPDVGNLRPN
jgi:hypothetical protein